MHIVILGSAAGGGFPQWNCNTEHCRLARSGSALSVSRSQSSIAVSADNRRFVLLNCSPDLRYQINQNKALHPNNGLRSSPIDAVVLTNGDVDHIAGLLTMRESEAFRIYASDRVQRILTSNSIFNVLNPDYVKRDTFELSRYFEINDAQGESLGLEIEAFAVPGKVALFLEDQSQGDNFGTREGDTVGLHIRDLHSDASFYYIPGCAQVPDTLKQRLDGAELLFFDGTLFRNDEMIQMGVGQKTGERMGHINMDGADGSLKAFSDVNIKRKLYIHINNTNPVLLENSPERKIVEDAGWTVSRDGQEITL
ncbi:MAG: pyrroloquinoline quinone biosynthesis protein PqqB [Gammaproteobacteria bacterium]|nr:pyrroloquinoline quinone biosynthesis protein PqqB [Gammaproteobacteria bacterium]